ncbi:MAG: DUF1269 domain-containing protein [Mesorhizobium sp.]|nr:MAG: DUF1269 domain-containing protein [Mesorhizobium sp.]
MRAQFRCAERALRFKGRIIRSSLPPEQVARLQEALSRARASDNAPSAGSASAA